MDFDHILSKEELNKLSLEQLKAYKAWLDKKQLTDEIEKATVTAGDNHPLQDLNAIRDAKKSGSTFEQVGQELVKINARLQMIEKEQSAGFKGLTLEKELTEGFGAEGKEIGSIAKDLAHALPVLDFVCQATGRPVDSLKLYKNNFQSVDRSKFKKAMEVIERKNALTAMRVKTGMDSTGAATGDEWVPTGFEPSILMHIQKSKSVNNAFRSFDMPTNPFDWPVSGAANNTYYVTESVTGGDITTAISNATSAKVTFSAGKLANRLELSEELNEDAAFAVFPSLLQIVADSVGDAYERVVMFGDTQNTTTNINKYGGSVTTTAGSADHYLLTKGLVYKALVDSNGSKKDVNSASSPSSAIRLVLQEMGDGAKNMLQNRVMVNPQFYFAMLDDDKLTGMDKVGAQATILTGQVGLVWGMPVFMTGGIPLTDSNGRVSSTTANNTLASFVVADSGKVLIGFRRRMRVAQDFVVETDKHKVVTSMRFDVQQLCSNASGRNPIGYGYNYPV